MSAPSWQTPTDWTDSSGQITTSWLNPVTVKSQPFTAAADACCSPASPRHPLGARSRPMSSFMISVVPP